jgi:hypothetical protein
VTRQRNNIYAVAADAVDLALDTAGTIGSMVGSVAHVIGIGGSGKEKSDEQARQEAHDAAERVATSLHQEVDAAKPRAHKAKTASASTHAGKRRSIKSKSAKRAAKSRAA